MAERLMARRNSAHAFLWLPLALLLTCVGVTSAFFETSLGCFSDTLLTPALTNVAANNPLVSTPLECSTACTSLGHTAYGLDGGGYCFCGDSAAAAALTVASTCAATCTGGGTCGSLTLGTFNLWTLAVIIPGKVNITFTGLTAPYVVAISTTLTLAVGGTTTYTVDWGDGSYAGTSVTTYAYTQPGIYTVTVRNALAPSFAGTAEVTVLNAPNFNMTCPTNYTLNVPTSCTVMGLVQGNNFTFSVSVATLFENISASGTLPATVYHMYGSFAELGGGVTLATATPSATSFIYNQLYGYVSQGGLLTKVEAATTASSGAAVLNIMALTPTCAVGVFCVDGCGTACSATCSGGVLCSPRGVCQGGCPATAAGGYQLISLVTVTIPPTGGVAVAVEVNPPIAVVEGTFLGFVNTAGAEFVTQNDTTNGDHSVSTADTTVVTAANMRHSVRMIVQDHPTVGVMPPFTCTVPAAVPVASVPTPYSVATELYANLSTINISLTVTSPLTPVMSVQQTALCQVPVLAPTLLPEVWMAYGSGLPLKISFIQGSSLVMRANISSTIYYNYYDNAGRPGGYTWSLPLLYPTEGLYTLTGTTFNGISSVIFSSIIHVVPNITDLWVFAAACPCYDWSSGFSLSLNWPATAHPPWNATININGTAVLETGSPYTTVLISGLVKNFNTYDGVTPPGGASGAAVALSWNQTFTDQAAGNYTVTAYLANEVSKTQVTITYEVKAAIRNVTANILWVQFDLNMAGTGPDKNVYIVNKTVLIFPTARTGVPENWKVQIFANGTEIEMLSGPNYPYVPFVFNTTFLNTGDYTIIVSGNNSVQGWIASPPINITLVDRIANFRLIDDLLIPEPNVTKTVQAMYDVLTSLSCLIVDYGDGSPLEAYGYQPRCNVSFANIAYHGDLISDPYPLNHKYSKEGLYTVTGLAFDHYVSMQSSLPVAIGDLCCLMPVAAITNAISYVYMAPKFYRMLSPSEQGTSMTYCNCSVNVTFEWSITQVDCVNATPVAVIPIMKVLPTWNMPSLSIQPQFLSVGCYLLTFSVTIHTKFNLTRSATTYIEIIPSPLSAVIINGSLTAVSRGFQQTVKLDPGTLSYDPDELGTAMTNVTWFCRQLSPTSEVLQTDSNGSPIITNVQIIPPPLQSVGMTGGGCFGKGPGTINISQTWYIFDMSTFCQTTGTFEMTAVIHKGVRQANATLRISVTPLPQPIVDIQCSQASLCWPLNDAQLVNPTQQLGLVGSCTDACTPTLYYHWTIMNGAGSPVQLIDPACNTSIPSAGSGPLVIAVDGPTCTQSLITPTDDSSLGISPTLFKINPSILRFTVQLTIITSDGRTGTSQITLQVNQPPIGGTCQMAYNQSLALLSQYDISCQNWKDPENLGISRYDYFYYLQGTNGSQIKTSLASTKQNAIPAVLPVGLLTMFIDVCDLLSSCTSVSVGVVDVQMISKDQFDLSNATQLLSKYTAEGNTAMVNMLIQAYNSVLLSANWTSLISPNTDNMTAAEIGELMLQLSNISSSQIAAIKASGTPTTLSQLYVQMQSLSSALNGVTRSDPAAYTLTLATRSDVMDILQSTVNSLQLMNVPTPAQYTPILISTLSTMTTMMKSADTIIKNGNKVPPGDLLFANDMEYNVDLGTNYDLVVPTDQNAILVNNVMDNSQRVFKQQTDQMLGYIQNISASIMKTLVKGQSTSAQTDDGASMLLTKVGEEMLAGGLTLQAPTDQNVKVVYPHHFCPSLQFNPYSTCHVEIGITMIVWPCITQFYSPTSNFLNYNTRIIQSEVSLANKVVTVQKQINPILFHISRFADRLLEPSYTNVSQDINTAVPLVYHYYNITIPQASYSFEITLSKPNKNLILLVSYNQYPLPSNYMKAYYISQLPYVNGTYLHFVDSLSNNNQTGKFIAAVGLLKQGKKLPNITNADLDSTFRSDYKFRVYISGCYFYNDTSTNWEYNQVFVTGASNTQTVCSTPHLTGFGSGFIPVPNTADFDFIIAHMGFFDNSTLYAVLIILIVMYIIMMIWAHFKDKKDYERRGVIPLPDNKPEDKYIYEITFYTGPDSDAPCESNISFIVSGVYDETPVRNLPKPNLNLYRRFDRNSFVMTTPAPLGNIHYLRVYHDNSGRPPYDSWQLECVVIRDLQQHKRYTFATNAWLAFNRDDGLIDQTFLCSDNNEDSIAFSQKLYSNTNKNTNQDHMWMSMFVRPIGSRFSRKERVTVCAVFLYLSMLVNAMWYQSSDDTTVTPYIKIGPIPITLSLVLTGLFVLLLVYPIALLLIMIFKRARPRNLKRCRALDAIEQQRLKQLVDNGEDEATAANKAEIEIDEEMEDTRTKDKPTVQCIPWWTRVLAWLLSLAAIAVSVLFVFSYGIMWGNNKTVQWFASFFTCFAVSLIVTQWLKVVIFALCSSVFTKTKKISEDIDCDEELPHLKSDEKWNYAKQLDPDSVRDIYNVEGVDYKEAEVRKLRTTLKKEREMKFVVKGIIVYCLYLVILLIIVKDKTDSNAYFMKSHLEKHFLKLGQDEEIDMSKSIKSQDDLWHWARENLMMDIRMQKLYNGNQPLGLKGYINDQQNRIIGYGILRQTRVRRFNCQVQHPMDIKILECTGQRGLLQEDINDYCAGWNLSGSCNEKEFKYRNASVVQTVSVVGALGIYSGGGYVIKLQGYQDDIINRLIQLQRMKWIDKHTRLVTLEFSVYNAQVNLFATIFVYFEFTDSGRILLNWRVEPVKLLNLGQAGYDQVLTLCEILFVAATVFFTFRQLWEIKKQKCGYFSGYWNLAELMLVLFSYLNIGLHFYKAYLTKENLAIFNKSHGNAYIRMDTAVFIEIVYVNIMAVIVFVSIVKLIKLFQFNKRMDVLALTIGRCWGELSYFFIAFGIVFFAFTCVFYFIFFTQLVHFSSLIASIQQCFAMMMGKFDFSAMQQANSISPLLYFIFAVTNSIVLINIMLTIILQSFTEIKLELSKKANKYEVLDFMWARLVKFSTQQPDAVNQVKVKPYIKKPLDGMQEVESDDLPDKINMLMMYINETYFNGKLDTNDSNAMKKALAAAKRRSEFSSNARTIRHSD